MKVDEVEKEFCQEVMVIVFEVEVDISGKLCEVFFVMFDYVEKIGIDFCIFQVGLVCYFEKLFLQICEEFQLFDGEVFDDISEFGWIE